MLKFSYHALTPDVGLPGKDCRKETITVVFERTMSTSDQDITLDELLIVLRKALKELLADTPVMLAYLYGSTAEGRTTPFSDIDVGLLLDASAFEKMQPYDCLMLETDLTQKLEGRLKVFDLDVRVVNSAPLMLQGRMLKDGCLLYSADENYRVGYESLTYKEYLDFLPIAKHFQDIYFEQKLKELQILDNAE